MPQQPFKEEAARWFSSLQDDICNQLEHLDGQSTFQEDAWERPGGGGGRSRLLKNGRVIEKGGVNFSAVHGKAPEAMLKKLNLPKANEFFATGVSIVLHPVSPMVPIIHMNVRYFEMDDGTYWFGGGIDLTPHYVRTRMARWFHRRLKMICDEFDPIWYLKFKKWADDYFYLKHRQETRGIGGIFFDRLTETDDTPKGHIWEFVKALGNAFCTMYIPMANKGMTLPYGEREKHWQLVRRSRYVEFNLLYDKGTRFGLDTNGRTESILMSMPPLAKWEYNYNVEAGSPEEQSQQWLKKGFIWASRPSSIEVDNPL